MARSGLVACRMMVALIALLSGLAVARAQTTPVRGEATLTGANGYARLLVKLDEDVESEVVTAGQILVIRFKRPIAVVMDKVADTLPSYIGSARRDPDGYAIRLALSRKVTVNTMAAGERLFVDLLPEGWTGAPPPLPADVVRQLAERARNAERALRQRQLMAESQKKPPIRVRTAVQPTFARFTFELPDGSGVSSSLNGQKLTLFFNSAFNFDLADAKVSAPSNVSAIEQKIEGDASTVDISVVGNVDVHTFREDKNYVVDIGFQQSEKPRANIIPEVKPQAAAPTTVAPVQQAKAEAVEPPLVAEAKPAPAAEIKLAAAGHDAPVIAAPPAAAPKPVAVAPEPPAPPVARPKAEPQPASATPAVTANVRRRSDGLTISLAFAVPTPAALFRRADTVWMVFDTDAPINVDAIRDSGGVIAEAVPMPLPRGQALRMRLNRPQLLSLSGDERSWTLSLAENQQEPPQPISLQRNISEPSRANLAIQLLNPGKTHRIVDPDAGDSIYVITANLPARGFVRRQDFVEFALLETVHGVAVLPKSDDVMVDTASGNIVVNRPGGMMMSPADAGPERATASVRPMFDPKQWAGFQQDDFFKQRQALVEATFTTNEEQKLAARLDLARFFMARGFLHEARGVLALALSDQKTGQEDAATLVLHAVASTLIGHPDQSLKDLANPVIAGNYDAQLWTALALARQQKWAEAREKFKNSEFAVTALPFDLQRVAILGALRSALEVKDFATATNRSNELDLVGVSAELLPQVAVLRGRLAESLNRDKDALRDYASAMQSQDREAATDARLRNLALKMKRKEMSEDEALAELETLAVTWRGDDFEIKTLQQLFRIYAARNRFVDAFTVAKTATRLQPNTAVTRELQDESAAMFAQLFLSPRSDEMPPIDALALFFDYRDLTPIGRRGDEMIRRLAERLVNVDLLEQAADLLQYQIEHRLEGAARAQVASRLATIHLMNRKPDRALGAIKTTRIADLAGEMRQQRLLLEARAQSDVGRHDLALDIISSSSGREVLRLRSDIYWASRRWRESSEQIELYYGDRWRDFSPLNAMEKSDLIRATVGYALADDSIGLARFREKYAPLMIGETDKSLFDLASQPAAGSSSDYAAIAKMAATVDTLEGFLRDMRVRFPETGARSGPAMSDADRGAAANLPEIKGKRIAGAEH